MKKFMLFSLCTLSIFAQSLEFSVIKKTHNDLQKVKPLKLNSYTYIVDSKPFYKKNILEFYVVMDEEEATKKNLSKGYLKNKTLYSSCKPFYRDAPSNFKMKVNYIYSYKKSKKIFTQVLVTQKACNDIL